MISRMPGRSQRGGQEFDPPVVHHPFSSQIPQKTRPSAPTVLHRRSADFEAETAVPLPIYSRRKVVGIARATETLMRYAILGFVGLLAIGCSGSPSPVGPSSSTSLTSLPGQTTTTTTTTLHLEAGVPTLVRTSTLQNGIVSTNIDGAWAAVIAWQDAGATARLEVQHMDGAIVATSTADASTTARTRWMGARAEQFTVWATSTRTQTVVVTVTAPTI